MMVKQQENTGLKKKTISFNISKIVVVKFHLQVPFRYVALHIKMEYNAGLTQNCSSRFAMVCWIACCMGMRLLLKL